MALGNPLACTPGSDLALPIEKRRKDIMKSRSVLATALAAIAVTASAQHNWILTSTYTYSLGDNWASTQLNMMGIMAGGSVDDSYGWGSSAWSFNRDSSPASLQFTTDWFDPFAAEPTLNESLFIGVATDMPGDPPGQKHIVFFMDSSAASNIEHIAWGTVFTTTLEAQLIDAYERAIVDFNDTEAWDFLNEFVNVKAKEAKVGPGGLPGSIWFGPNENFSIVAFSDALIIGDGFNSVSTEFVPVPEPASMAALGLGAAALLRRRRKA